MGAQDKHFTVVVNAKAGTVLETGAEVFAQRIESAFAGHGCRADVHCVAPDALDDALSSAIADEATVPVIAGGDGTINGVLPILRTARRPIGILPLGTVNVLGRDLGMHVPLGQQVETLCKGEVATLDLGLLNERLFHSISGMGFFSLMAREREQARRRFPFSRAAAFVWAASRSILFTRPITVDIRVGDDHTIVEADAVLVTVNDFDGPDWSRSRLDGGVFEVHILNAAGLLARCRAALGVATGRWRSSPRLTSIVGQAVTLRRRDKRRGHITYDGEVSRIAGTLEYRIVPAALEVIAARRGARA